MQTAEAPKEEEQMLELMTEDYMEEHWAELDKKEVSKYQLMSPGFIEKHKDELDWNLLSQNMLSLTFEILDKYPDRINWINISLNAKSLSDSFLYNYSSKLQWDIVLSQRVPSLTLRIHLSEKYRKTNAKNKQDFWSSVSRYLALEPSYVEIYKRYIDFTELTRNKNLSDEVIDKFIDQLDLHTLVRIRKLSKGLLQKHAQTLAPYLMDADKIQEQSAVKMAE